LEQTSLGNGAEMVGPVDIWRLIYVDRANMARISPEWICGRPYRT
jgi:hypothetical protein